MTLTSPARPVRALGVITVTFNAAQFLHPFLVCCLDQTHSEFELLIIDNNSTDDTLEILTSVSSPHIKIIDNKNNVGYAAACNQGVCYFLERGVENILFLNNDTEFKSDLFESLQALRVYHNADAITPRITFFDNPDINWYAGGRLTFWKGFQGEHLGEGKRNNPANVEPKWTPVAPGCCVMFASSTFGRVGLFDPSYFVYFEDIDYFIRMSEAKLRLLYAPEIEIAHKISLSTGGSQSDFSIYYYQRNQVYLLRKHFRKFTILLQLMVIVIKAFIRFLLGRDSFRQFGLRLLSLRAGLKMRIHADVRIAPSLHC